jgi:hypothetical protein
MGLIADLDATVKKISFTHWESNGESPAAQPVDQSLYSLSYTADIH